MLRREVMLDPVRHHAKLDDQQQESDGAEQRRRIEPTVCAPCCNAATCLARMYRQVNYPSTNVIAVMEVSENW
jgi:hypothetical protein